MSRHITLSVNNEPIELDYFVQGFIDHTSEGIIGALEGTGKIDTLNISIEANKVHITLNNADIPVNTFASKIINNTISGMVSSLRDVNGINQLEINIERN